MISVFVVLIGLLIVGVLNNSLTIITLSFLWVILSYKLDWLKKYRVIYYLIALVLACVSLVVETSYLRYLNHGFLGYSFLLVVMFTGVLPKGFGLRKSLLKNRGMFSILSFILISAHTLDHLFFLGDIDLVGLVSYVLMIPLTIISFDLIRKEMSFKDWKNIQKISYVIYGLIFTHLLIVSTWDNKLVYAVLLTLYLNNKLIKELKK